MASVEENRKELIFHETYLKAVLDNKNNVSHWTNYKERYEEVIQNLKFYNEKSKHAVCISLGNKAFVKGHLVHTNDVWVTLGCGYFLKTSTKSAVEICERRIRAAQELIEKWNKEIELLKSIKDFSVNKDIFGGEENKEIIEPFSEAEEQKWKEEHREKEKKYRQQLKTLRNKTDSSIIKDEKDLWGHLDALELQEELEDELNRLGSTSDDDLSDSDDTSTENYEEVDVKEGAYSTVEDARIKEDSISQKIVEVLRDKNNDKDHKVKKVSFVNGLLTDNSKFSTKELLKRDVPEAVLDVVVEQISSVKFSDKKNDQMRPVSKFKMNRMKQE